MTKSTGLVILTSFIGASCTTTQQAASPITFEQWRQERSQLPEKIEKVLAMTKSAFELNKTRFDKCFVNETAVKVDGQGLLKFTVYPQEGRFILEDAASPEQLTGLQQKNFGQCVDTLMATFKLAPDTGFGFSEKYTALVRVIFPSWVNGGERETDILPKGFKLPNEDVCMLAIREYFEVQNWDALENDGRYFSHSFNPKGQDELFLCSGQDLSTLLRYDETAARKKFPSVPAHHRIVDGIR